MEGRTFRLWKVMGCGERGKGRGTLIWVRVGLGVCLGAEDGSMEEVDKE